MVNRHFDTSRQTGSTVAIRLGVEFEMSVNSSTRCSDEIVVSEVTEVAAFLRSQIIGNALF